MRSESFDSVVKAHGGDYARIVEAVARADQRRRSDSPEPEYLQREAAKTYQKFVFHQFRDTIRIPSFEYISKSPHGWLIVGDHRQEIAARICLLIELYGIGVGMMVLHAQQMNSRYIPLVINLDGEAMDVSKATPAIHGAQGEHLIHVPLRKYRGHSGKLAELSIAKPRALWDRSRIFGHKLDPAPFCHYCSSEEINPGEVVVRIDGRRRGLSRNYCLGFTFAPFGNPLTVMHFLAWDDAVHPVNMGRTPMTVSDLVELTRQINVSISEFFDGTGITEYPVIDGLSNGRAGNSIYHGHYQFFQPEYGSPLQDSRLVSREPVLTSDDISVRRLSWPVPVYMFSACDSLNVGLVGNDMAGFWHSTGRTSTQNIYVPGCDHGRRALVVLRDSKRVDYLPDAAAFVSKEWVKAQMHKNIGVLEATGTLIIDDKAVFDEFETWAPSEISEQVRLMTSAVAPIEAKVARFEKRVRRLMA